MRVLAVVPARGGSKGVPGKNLRPVGGRPLLAWTLDVAQQAMDAGLVQRTLVSTDEPAIADVARGLGFDVPFLRPADLAGDRTPMHPVLAHALGWAEEEAGAAFDWILLLQPTNPFRTLADVAEALALARAGGCDSVISVVRVYATHPVLMKRIENGLLVPFAVEEVEGTRRQDYTPAAYMRNGAIYLTRRQVLLELASIWGGRIRPYEMPEERSAGIDTEIDLRLVDLLMTERAH